jgi:predicted adenylyl cyclase CyaB
VQNIELKARLADLEGARRVARTLATSRLGMHHQVDTYFASRNGRLKLREIDGHTSQLIWYARPDDLGPKASDYQVVPVADGEAMKSALTAALGVRAVVQKRRDIYLWHNVRIHLDEVAGLGTFLEFEAVLGPGVDEAAARAQVDHLLGRFAIAPADLLAGSYGEMARPV